jgi:hypothetical protein
MHHFAGLTFSSAEGDKREYAVCLCNLGSIIRMSCIIAVRQCRPSELPLVLQYDVRNEVYFFKLFSVSARQSLSYITFSRTLFNHLQIEWCWFKTFYVVVSNYTCILHIVFVPWQNVVLDSDTEQSMCNLCSRPSYCKTSR